MVTVSHTNQADFYTSQVRQKIENEKQRVQDFDASRYELIIRRDVWQILCERYQLCTRYVGTDKSPEFFGIKVKIKSEDECDSIVLQRPPLRVLKATGRGLVEYHTIITPKGYAIYFKPHLFRKEDTVFIEAEIKNGRARLSCTNDIMTTLKLKGCDLSLLPALAKGDGEFGRQHFSSMIYDHENNGFFSEWHNISEIPHEALRFMRGLDHTIGAMLQEETLGNVVRLKGLSK